MHKIKHEGNIEAVDKILVSTNTLKELLDCGEQTAVEIGKQAGAKFCIRESNRVLWNVQKLREYLNSN